ncbi:MAG: bile acid:sodium symporter [Acidimicrobiia bacterium]
MDGLFTGLIFITVTLTALAIGMQTSASLLRAALRMRVFLLTVAVNVLVVPLLGWLVVALMPLPPGSRAGVLLCSICAAGPIALKASQIARADLTWSLALTVVLLVLNAVSLPVWSSVTIGETVALRPADLVMVLVVAILLPVVVGTVVRAKTPTRADWWSSWSTRVSNLTFVLAVGVGVAANVDEIATSVSVWLLSAALIIIAMAGVVGWLLTTDVGRRRAGSLTTLNRATSVALLAVARAFAGEAEMFTAIVVFGLIQTVAALGLSVYWGRTGSPEPVAV